MSYREVSEVRDGMQIDWDMPITMDDGLVLRCDVFRPLKKGRYPVLLSYGPYGKWLHFEDGYKTAWDRMALKHPDVMAGSTNKYQSWDCLLYTSDAADERSSVDLGGRRIIKKKKKRRN